MNIYWQDADGSIPPTDAVFGWVPFSKDFLLPKIEQVTRIEELPPPTKPIRIIQKSFLPHKKQWCENILKAKEALSHNILEKVVLARIATFECITPPDPFAITAKLKSRAKNATVFCYAFENMAFLGASPELLFSKQGNTIQTEAVAGTLRRGNTPKEDVRLEKELFDSEKAQSEIYPVIHYLKRNLPSLSFSPVYVKKTPNVQHLCAKAEGICEETLDNSAIIQKIHPTPALLGLPTNAALDFIKKTESFQRGLYGGTLGWSTPQKSVWIVAIRCCLIQGATVKLYTGAGIVPGSNPEEEWDELNHKMELYKDIFI
jgi:menaquinone-specific isochorismate synthase